MKFVKPMERMAFLSMASFSLFIYASIAASSIGHILLILPGFYFTYLGWNKVSLPWSAKFLTLFILIASITAFFSESLADPFHTLGELRYFWAGILSIPAFSVVFITKVTDLEKFDKRIKFLIYSSLIVAAVGSISGIIGLYSGFNPLRLQASTDPHRATGLYSMAITFGYGIQFMALINFSLLIFYDKIKQYIRLRTLVITMICIFLGLYFSGSRGALLGFLAGIPFLFIRLHRQRFYYIMGASALLLLAVTAIIFSGGSTTSRFLLPAKHGSNMIRISQYEAAYEAIKERPFIGHGYRNFGNISERIKKEHNIAYPDFISHAHNNYLEIWADIGIFGLLAFIAFLGAWFVEAWRRQDLVGDTTLSIVVALIVSGSFQCTIIDGENAFAIMFIYGLSQVTMARIKGFRSLLKP